MAKKSKKYISEKEITKDGKSFWVKKTEDQIKVVDGEDTVFEGSANGYQIWLKHGKV